METKKSHFFLIDSFRGLASLWIVAFHILPGYLPEISWLHTFISFGRIGTDFFFVASGYVSAIACYKIISTDDKQSFALKRLKTIYSIYLYSLVLALIIIPSCMGIVSFLKTGILIFDINFPSLRDLFLYLSLLKVFTNETWALNNAFVEINGVYWFIAIITQIYLFLGIALKFKSKFYFIVSITFLFSLLCLFGDIKKYVPIGLFLPYFSNFFIGMLLYFFIKNRHENISKQSQVLLVCLLVALFSLIIYFHTNGITGNFYRFLSALTVSLVLYLMYPIDNLIRNSLLGRFTSFLGSISYSTYLNHIIFWPFMYMFVSNLIPLPLSISAPFFLIPLVMMCCYLSHVVFVNPGLSGCVKRIKLFNSK